MGNHEELSMQDQDLHDKFHKLALGENEPNKAVKTSKDQSVKTGDDEGFLQAEFQKLSVYCAENNEEFQKLSVNDAEKEEEFQKLSEDDAEKEEEFQKLSEDDAEKEEEFQKLSVDDAEKEGEFQKLSEDDAEKEEERVEKKEVHEAHDDELEGKEEDDLHRKEVKEVDEDGITGKSETGAKNACENSEPSTPEGTEKPFVSSRQIAHKEAGPESSEGETFETKNSVCSGFVVKGPAQPCIPTKFGTERYIPYQSTTPITIDWDGPNQDETRVPRITPKHPENKPGNKRPASNRIEEPPTGYSRNGPVESSVDAWQIDDRLDSIEEFLNNMQPLYPAGKTIPDFQKVPPTYTGQVIPKELIPVSTIPSAPVVTQLIPISSESKRAPIELSPTQDWNSPSPAQSVPGSGGQLPPYHYHPTPSPHFTDPSSVDSGYSNPPSNQSASGSSFIYGSPGPASARSSRGSCSNPPSNQSAAELDELSPAPLSIGTSNPPSVESDIHTGSPLSDPSVLTDIAELIANDEKKKEQLCQEKGVADILKKIKREAEYIEQRQAQQFIEEFENYPPHSNNMIPSLSSSQAAAVPGSMKLPQTLHPSQSTAPRTDMTSSQQPDYSPIFTQVQSPPPHQGLIKSSPPHMSPTQGQAQALLPHMSPTQGQGQALLPHMSPTQGEAQAPPPHMSHTQGQGQALLPHMSHTQGEAQAPPPHMSHTQGQGQALLPHMSPTQGQGQALQPHMSPTQGQGQALLPHMSPTQGQGQALQPHMSPTQGQGQAPPPHMSPTDGQGQALPQQTYMNPTQALNPTMFNATQPPQYGAHTLLPEMIAPVTSRHNIIPVTFPSGYTAVTVPSNPPVNTVHCTGPPASNVTPITIILPPARYAPAIPTTVATHNGGTERKKIIRIAPAPDPAQAGQFNQNGPPRSIYSPNNVPGTVTVSSQSPSVITHQARSEFSPNYANEYALANLRVSKMSLAELTSVDSDGDSQLHLWIVQDPIGAEALIHRLVREDQMQQMINRKNRLWQTPLYLAVRTNRPKLVGELIKYGADVNCEAQLPASASKERNTRTALHTATMMGQQWIPVLDQLLSTPAIDVNATNYAGETPLHLAVQEHGRRGSKGGQQKNMSETIRKLLLKGASLKQGHRTSGRTPLHQLVEKKDPDLLQFVLQLAREIQPHTPNPNQVFMNDIMNAKSYDGTTPLHLAAGSDVPSVEQHLRIIRLLLSHGADATRKNNNNSTPKDMVFQKRQPIIDALRGQQRPS